MFQEKIGVIIIRELAKFHIKEGGGGNGKRRLAKHTDLYKIITINHSLPPFRKRIDFSIVERSGPLHL